jgi:hypothetical protein
VTTQPDTDAPPTGPWGPTDLFPIEEIEPDHFASDAPQEGRPTTPQTEAPLLWLMRQMLNRGIADESNRDTLAAIFDEAKERYPEAAAGALPSVEVAALVQAVDDYIEDPRSMTPIYRAREVLRLAAAPPEASER